ncbi:CsiV family protein [Cellvibrio mixtus]|uniref:CsiV family protein n=1 Tax=Cellvibrio mixtus TaxID=39650 RepID=UPI00058705F4|nr:CsiV family protein [Cellvibrio mixtus]
MMYFCKKLYQSLMGLATLLLVSNSLHAQQSASNHEGWYQVELIVFARKEDTSQEHWPSNIKLRYPGDWVELKDPAMSDVKIDLTKEAFYRLPASERQLNAQAQKLERNGRFELLFHSAWRQIITNKKSSKAILISGGPTSGKHQALEGSIRVSVATYLELQTNLWFSQFDLNVGQEVTQSWPEIPLRPNYPAVGGNTLSLDSDLELDQALAKENQQGISANVDSGTAAKTNGAVPEYITRQIILLQQERDMRSGEIHYIDHPVLGVIVQVTPYPPTTLQ